MSRAILGTTAQAECDVTDLPRWDVVEEGNSPLTGSVLHHRTVEVYTLTWTVVSYDGPASLR